MNGGVNSHHPVAPQVSVISMETDVRPVGEATFQSLSIGRPAVYTFSEKRSKNKPAMKATHIHKVRGGLVTADVRSGTKNILGGGSSFTLPQK